MQNLRLQGAKHLSTIHKKKKKKEKKGLHYLRRDINLTLNIIQYQVW